MKKIFSALLVFCMLATSCFLLASCGGVSEKSVARDPLGTISKAIDSSLSAFFSEGKAMDDINAKAAEKGSYNLILATDEFFGDGKLYELDEMLYIDSKAAALVSETKLTVAGTSYRASLWADKESFALKSESLFGNKDTLFVNFARFLTDFEDSDLNAALGLDAEMTTQLLHLVETLTKSLDEKESVIPEKEAKELESDLYKALGQQITKKTMTVGDTKEADYIVASYTVDNDSIEALAELYLRVAEDYELSVGITEDELRETVDAMLDDINASGDLELSCSFVINAKTGALAELDIEATFDPAADSYTTAFEVEFALVLSDSLLTLEGTAKIGADIYTVTAEAEKTVKGDKTTFTFEAGARKGNVRIDLIDITYIYDADAAEIEIEGFVALNADDRIDFDAKATFEIEKDKYTIAVDSFEASHNGDEMLNFKQARNNEISLTVSVVDELPERDPKAMDILDLTEEDLSQLVTDIQNSDLGQLIFGSAGEALPEDEGWAW